MTRYRNLGGNLMFLATTNFLWSITKHGSLIYRGRLWRNLGRPEARLIGVQYRSNDGGKHQARYIVAGADSLPGPSRVPVSRTVTSSGTVALRSISGLPTHPRRCSSSSCPHLHPGVGSSAEMTYYSTAAGAKVFAAGTLNFGGGTRDPVVSRILQNLWTRLSRP